MSWLRFFDTLGLSELWVGFKKYRDIPVHSLHAGLGPSKYIALTLFHSLTGWDTTSQFLGCGKKTARAAWNSFPDLTDTLSRPQTINLYDGFVCHDAVVVVAVTSD